MFRQLSYVSKILNYVSATNTTILTKLAKELEITYIISPLAVLHHASKNYDVLITAIEIE